jgi:hypothetical protein
MRRSDFATLEYPALRKEIEETKARLFKLAGFGIVGLPGAYSVAKIYEIGVLTLSLPILICTIVLLYVSESHALMRCGRYVRHVVESQIVGQDDKPILGEDGRPIGGWEWWLEQKVSNEPDRRLVDKLLAVFFYLLFFFYYVASVALSAQLANRLWGVLGLAIALGTYIGVGILFIVVLILGFRRSVSTL